MITHVYPIFCLKPGRLAKRHLPQGLGVSIQQDRMGNAQGGREVVEVAKEEEGNTDGMETSHTATTSSDSSPEIISEQDTTSPPLVLASTVPDDLSHLLEEAIATCKKHERIDIIITYLCNLHAIPKEVSEIATELNHIAHLQDTIHSTFVCIRY